ncbi:type II toxin-antitoxin system RelE/ParE family toxin [Rhizobium sp. 0TCS1.26]|uniref:type II toxin-antitoxin system RelE family toxin n=1 Tax=Rhizobium sp. 0TCS1.26 TaxID=3142623 RepID=UPI003D274218
MAWTIEYRQSVRKSMEKLDPVIRPRIRRFLEDRVATLDDPRQSAERLQGPELGHYWRYRVGHFRIICDIQARDWLFWSSRLTIEAGFSVDP